MRISDIYKHIPDLECNIEEYRGFLKYVCSSMDNPRIVNKCHNSDEVYQLKLEGFFTGQLCSNDPHFYLACQKNIESKRTVITNNDVLCGQFVCEQHDGKTMNNQDIPSILCDGRKDCKNTDVDETWCFRPDEKMTTMPSGKSVPTTYLCDDVCDDSNCEDEASCNGYMYGMYCDLNMTTNTKTYIPPLKICDRNLDCQDRTDEIVCWIALKNEEKCQKGTFKLGIFWENFDVPVFNFTRCYTLQIRNSWHESRYCSVGNSLISDQTNCTDQEKVGLTCLVNGYMTTVSKQAICSSLKQTVCDDNLDEICIKCSETCFVHKHFMCDGKLDCEDKTDETHLSCLKQTREICKRRVGDMEELPVPLTWLEDGFKDCEDGRDEMKVWPTCGKGKSLRYVTTNETCENVYVCPVEKPGFVEFEDLCDGVETCGNENKLCSRSNSFEGLSTKVLTTDKGLKNNLAFCKTGLKSIQKFDDMNCSTLHSDPFIYPNTTFFGLHKTEVILPSEPKTCDHMFGEMYVYTSCLNKCINSSCPIKSIPRYEVCPDQYPDRIGTIVNNDFLTFVTKSFGNIYTNRYFVCDNRIKCIDYSKVCDLVDDCLDGSDEESCTNHFKCTSTGKYIPKTSTCDGSFDCLDLSDECNEQCSSDIIESTALKGFSWLIGSLAVLANAIIISQNAVSLRKCQSTVALLNKSLIMAISSGDFLVGCYLIVISIYDGFIYKQSYCKNQINWITSTNCSVIGVLSTSGSQVSLFAMCVLSVTRIIGICNSMRVPGEVTWIKSVKVTVSLIIMILISFTIAIIPIVDRFEDFFVNGVKYEEELKVFLGTPNKQTILEILESYYGRMKKTTLSWKMINQMVKGMYSHDFQYPDHTSKILKVDFYGNDGVCLFKYFVKDQDPQRLFVWTILALNFICFMFITVSYLIIGYFSYKSSKSLTKSGGNQQISQRNRKMNRKISIIITTDFLCWVPFIVICVLHSVEVLDATPWYSLFSIIILPINSVINPLIYDETITNLISAPLQQVRTYFVRTRVYRDISLRLTSRRETTVETIEMESRQS